MVPCGTKSDSFPIEKSFILWKFLWTKVEPNLKPNIHERAVARPAWPGIGSIWDVTAVEGRDTWEWPPITLPACLPPPGLTLHAPFVGGDKIVPIIQGRAGRYHSQLRDLLKAFFIKLSIQLHQKRSIQDLGSHRPRGPSIIIMGGRPAVSGVLVHGANLIETRRWDKQTLARHTGEQVSKSWQDKQETWYMLAHQANLEETSIWQNTDTEARTFVSILLDRHHGLDPAELMGNRSRLLPYLKRRWETFPSKSRSVWFKGFHRHLGFLLKWIYLARPSPWILSWAQCQNKTRSH